MSNETRITDPKTGGQKGSKPERYDLIPPGFLLPSVLPRLENTEAGKFVQEAIAALDAFRLSSEREVSYLTEAFYQFFSALVAEGFHPGDELAQVYGSGAVKYEPWNWLKGYAWSLSFASVCRHAALWGAGTRYDKETGHPHLAHAAWHCVTLSTFARYQLGTDDLYRAPAVP